MLKNLLVRLRLHVAILGTAVGLVTCLLMAAPAHAATVTWTGAVNGTASLRGNWDAVIATGDTLLINSGSTSITFDTAFATSGTRIYTTSGYTGTIGVTSSTISFSSSTFAGGIFGCGANTCNFSGTVTVGGATITSGAGTIAMVGSFGLNINSGTFISNSGSVTVGGALAQVGGALTVSGPMTVSGAMTITGGTVGVGTAKTLTVSGAYSNSGGTVTLTGTGKIVNAYSLVALVDSANNTKTSYSSTETIFVRVQDNNRNLDAASAETMSIVLSTTGQSQDIETLVLTETGAATGIFSGNIPFKGPSNISVGDNVLEATADGTITYRYTDSADTSDTAVAVAAYSVGTPKTLSPPTNTTVSFSGTPAADGSVKLSLGATNALQMVVSNYADFHDATWETYVTTRAWKLLPGAGTKAVHVMFESPDGVRSNDITAMVDVAVNTPIVTLPLPPVVLPPVLPVPPVVLLPAPVFEPVAPPAAVQPLPVSPAPLVVIEFTRVLKEGAHGADVAQLQTLLIERGALKLPKGIAKGYYGAMTRNAIKKFQKSMKLKQTGSFDEATEAALVQ